MTGRLVRRLWEVVRASGALLRGLAKELSDEAAYERHLAGCAVAHSPQEWRKFSDARLKRKYQQGKCC